MIDYQNKPTDLHSWRKEKSRNVIEYLAIALTCHQTPKSREFICHAIRDAAKLFTSELQIELGRQFPQLPDVITNSVRRSPRTAEKFLNETVATLRGNAISCGPPIWSRLPVTPGDQSGLEHQPPRHPPAG